MTTLLDTNVLSELLRERPAAPVLAWFSRQARVSLVTTTVTEAEMMLGARLLAAGKKRDALEASLAALFEEDFAGRVLPFDRAAVGPYVAIVERRRRSGRPIAQFDAQIAAIAASRRTRIATRDVTGFDGCGVEVVDPWSGQG